MKLRNASLYEVVLKASDREINVAIVADGLGQAVERGKSLAPFAKELQLPEVFGKVKDLEVLGATPTHQAFAAAYPGPTPVLGACHIATFADPKRLSLDELVRSATETLLASKNPEVVAEAAKALGDQKGRDALREKLLAEAPALVNELADQTVFGAGVRLKIVAPTFVDAAMIAAELPEPEHRDLFWKDGWKPQKSLLLTLDYRHLVII
jgi:hypothetical protein